jgi:transposase-like protein/predicted RNA-binding Zn-ribbon protein involved in translation (DUF1610 family)
MEEYPMTFEEFERRFSTEEDCRKYLTDLRWPEGFVCPKCGCSKAWKIGNALLECSKCGHQTSVIAGTIFQDTRKPLKSWFTAMWWIATQKNGASAKGLQQVLGLKSYQTSWSWLHKMRTAMVIPSREMLAGRVEVDETYIGGIQRGGKPGRGSENKILVAIAIELKEHNKLGRVRMNIINDASKKSLHDFVTATIMTGSEIVTDGWISYVGIDERGYKHTILNTNGEVDADDNTLPHVHLVISLLKRWLLGTHQGKFSEKHLAYYLDEYTFRFNRRKAKQRGLLFYRLLEQAVKTAPLSYHALTSRTTRYGSNLS